MCGGAEILELYMTYGHGGEEVGSLEDVYAWRRRGLELWRWQQALEIVEGSRGNAKQSSGGGGSKVAARGSSKVATRQY